MKEERVPFLCVQAGLVAMLLTGIGLAVPRLAEDLGFSLAQQGMLISVQYVGATAAVFLGGLLSDRFGRAFITRLFFIIGSLVCIIFGMSGGYASALAATVLVGAVSLITENAVMSSGLDLGEKSRRANSLIQVSFSVGAILIPLLFLLFQRFGLWRPVYFVLAVICAAVAAASKGRPGGRASESPRVMLAKYLSYFKKPSYIFGPVTVFLYVAAEIGLWALAPAFFEAGGYGQLSGIVSALLVWTLMLVGRIISTALLSKIGFTRILIPSGILGVFSYALIMMSDGVLPLVGTALAGFACAPFYSSLTSISTEVSGDNSSTYLAFVMGLGTLGPALLGGVGGAAGAAFGPRFIVLPPLICFALLMICVVWYAVKYPEKKRK